MKCYNCQKEISQVNICPYCEKNQIFETLSFNVKGVTYENEDGKDIQKEIRKIFLEYERNGCFEKYGGYTNDEIKEYVTEVSEFEDVKVQMDLKEDIYEDKPCIKIYIKKYDDSFCHIGYMPKGLVKKYLKLKKYFKEIKMSINLVGGKIKQLRYDYETEKEKVEIVDLTYGFEVELILYNDLEKYKLQIEKNKKETIERYKKILQEDQEKEQEEKRIKEEFYKKRQKEANENYNKRLKEEEKKRKENTEKIEKEIKQRKNDDFINMIIAIFVIIGIPIIIIYFLIKHFISLG